MTVEILCALAPARLGAALRDRLHPHSVTLVDAAVAAIDAALQRRVPSLILAGREAFDNRDVGDWVRRVANLPGSPDVVLIHHREDSELRASLLRAGCLAVLYSGLSPDDLAGTIRALVERRLERRRLEALARSPQGPCRLDDFVSDSPVMREFLRTARQVVAADSSLLLLGETGTGKERLARALHEEGPRSGGPFVAVNCGALPDSLMESELFGHQRGSFTGAARDHRGYFEQAHGGTIFLDEIGEVPPHVQVRLLRVVEQRRVQRVGSETSLPVDLRVMAATNRDLEREVADGRFRRDLFYRLAVVTLAIPPLRDRSDDVPALVHSYLAHFRAALNRPIHGIEESAMRALVAYDWPGNVRELINVVERAILLAPGTDVTLADLPRAISRGGSGPASDREPAPADDLYGRPLLEARDTVVARFEREYLSRLLVAHCGRVGAAARAAGLNERSLYELLRKYGLRKELFRSGPDARHPPK